MRVLTRTMQPASRAMDDPPGRVRTRLRSVTRRVLTIGYQARSPTTRDALVQSYRKLMATTRAVLRDADAMVRRLAQCRRTATPGTAAILARAQQQLQHRRPLVRRVVAQTAGATVGRRHTRPGQSPEPLRTAHRNDSQGQDLEAERIRGPGDHSRSGTSNHHRLRGARATTGRRRVVDASLGSCIRRSSTGPRLWRPAIRGFSSAANEQAATDRGVRRVIPPRRGPKSPARRAHERQGWFRRGQRWRVGCEGRISVIKRRHGLRRCRYHGTDGMARWVGLGVIADNLINTATFVKARAAA